MSHDHIIWVDKDPDEIKDYEHDWANRLATGETITTVTWTLSNGLTSVNATNTDTTTTIMLGDGDLGSTALVRCTIVTNQGRTLIKSAEVNIHAL